MILLGSLVQAQDVAPFPPAPRDVSSITRIVSDDEPGERLVITGTIYKSDKKTPYEGLVLYFYQTDATGVYNKTNGSWQEPRLRGWVKTDANGRYEVRTVKPGSYPTRREAAHIHVTMKPAGGSPLWLDSFLFENDPYLGDRDLREAAGAGSFSHILKVTKGKDKTLRCVRDFLITAED
jgi:protocatechuate 3,4-dioxygenase beta subunit